MANNTTWSFTGLPSGSSILSYSPEIPGVVFGLVNSDGGHTVLNARGTPTQAGSFNPTIRVGTNACYKDVRVNLSVSPAGAPAPVAAPDCGIFFNDPAKNHLDFLLYISGSKVGIEISTLEIAAPVDIARVTDKYGVSISWLSGDPLLQGMSLIWVPKTATWGAVEPTNRTELTPALTRVPIADLLALNGRIFSAVFRATSSTCTLDFPVNVTLNSSSLGSSGGPGTVEGGG